MPATTSLGSYTLSNLGALTTTFTPAPSCSTQYWGVEIGEYDIFTDEVNSTQTTSSEVIYYGSPCGETYASFSDCVPSGSVLDNLWNSLTSTRSGAPFTQGTIDYYSPGIVCPSGYETVGVASKLSGGIASSSGAAFVPAVTPASETFDLSDPAPNVLLQAMLEGESAILCCPSGYTASVNGACTSTIASYPLPSEVCVEVVNGDDIETPDPTVTLTEYGSVYTGEILSITGTAPDSTWTRQLTTATTLGTSSAQSYVAMDVVEVLFLVHAASDTATAGSNATGNTSGRTAERVGLSAIMTIFTVVMAFTSGFMMLIV